MSESASAAVAIRPYSGDRDLLRHLFELAEDSTSALNAYLGDGVIFVAETKGAVVGHLQLVLNTVAQLAEIKNMAVIESLQGNGIGRNLVTAAVGATRDAGVPRLIVATAAADVGNLRFYQRQGFRMSTIDRDAFTPATGYPRPIVINGIELRDRVWLDRLV